MPTDMSKYPKDWKEIRNRILLRAGGNEDDPRVGARCEHCGLQNYDVVARCGGVLMFVKSPYVSHEDARRAKIDAEKHTGLGYSVVVLTISHIHDMNPQNVDESNLAALCQKCHNSHDVQYRKRNRATTRRARIVENGQAVLI